MDAFLLPVAARRVADAIAADDAGGGGMIFFNTIMHAREGLLFAEAFVRRLDGSFLEVQVLHLISQPAFAILFF